MLDLEGKELEVGAIYHMLGSGSKVVICKFSHETECSLVFKYVKILNRLGDVIVYTWKRQLPKYKYKTNCPVLRVSQELIDKYQIV